jgi:hypothetical protein
VTPRINDGTAAENAFRFVQPSEIREQVIRQTLTYMIEGTKVTLDHPPCGPNELCVGPTIGDINFERVLLPFPFRAFDFSTGAVILPRRTSK